MYLGSFDSIVGAAATTAASLSTRQTATLTARFDQFKKPDPQNFFKDHAERTPFKTKSVLLDILF